jgi:hypothetical protein
MTGPVDSLWHEIRNRFERLPVWLPGTPMQLGDIGVFGRSGWSKQSSLAGQGIGFSADVDGVPVTYDYSSNDGTQVDLRAAASLDPTPQAVAGGNLGLQVEFSREGAFLLRAGAVRVSRIADLAELDRQILGRHERRSWPPEWIVVSEVAEGGPSITLISGGKQGRAVVDLGVTAAGAGGDLIGMGCRLEAASSLAASFVSATRTALLWRGRCVHISRFRRKSWMDDRRTSNELDLPQGTGPRVINIEYPEDLPSATDS